VIIAASLVELKMYLVDRYSDKCSGFQPYELWFLELFIKEVIKVHCHISSFPLIWHYTICLLHVVFVSRFLVFG